jgi:hypothetical protein
MTKETTNTTIENDDPTLLKTIEVLEPVQKEMALPQKAVEGDTTSIAIQKAEKIVIQGNNSSIYNDTGKFEHLQRIAKLYSNSTMVPECYRNNASNCFIAIDLAMQFNIPIFQFMNGSDVLQLKNGDRFALRGQTVIGIVNNSGRFSSDLNFTYSGDVSKLEFTCTAWAIDKRSERKEFILSVGEAMKIGSAANNPQWKSVPRLMITYRAATYFARVHCPEVLLGMQTTEEMQDMNVVQARVVSNNVTSQETQNLNNKYFSSIKKEEPIDVTQ